jgi:flagellar secretion chaperone FliS
MSSRMNPLAAYGKVANAETNPLQQIIMLYEGAIKFLRLAAADIVVGDVAAKAEHTTRALDIINYLQSVLDFERGGDVAPALDLFYTSLMLQILKASATLDGNLMEQAAEMLQPVREAWAAQAPAPAFAVMGQPPIAALHPLVA